MLQAFYQGKPERDTPYRELILKHDEQSRWRVLLLGGESWGKQASSPISEVAVKDFDEGRVEYDRISDN